MPHGRRWIAGLLIISGLLLSACSAVPEEEEALNEPATLEPIDGTDVSRITLTAEAAERVDIQADPVLAAGSATMIPYAAVFYTATGDTWTYTNPEPLTFVRVPIVVDHISGDRAFLSDGPPRGMEVVTQGASELYGTETDVEE
jgi:multidrug efflux pump subunit AcrA (membrane-fusion protein)